MAPGVRFSEDPNLFEPISGTATHTVSCKQIISKHETLLEVKYFLS